MLPVQPQRVRIGPRTPPTTPPPSTSPSLSPSPSPGGRRRRPSRSRDRSASSSRRHSRSWSRSRSSLSPIERRLQDFKSHARDEDYGEYNRFKSFIEVDWRDTKLAAAHPAAAPAPALASAPAAARSSPAPATSAAAPPAGPGPETNALFAAALPAPAGPAGPAGPWSGGDTDRARPVAEQHMIHHSTDQFRPRGVDYQGRLFVYRPHHGSDFVRSGMQPWAPPQHGVRYPSPAPLHRQTAQVSDHLVCRYPEESNYREYPPEHPRRLLPQEHPYSEYPPPQYSQSEYSEIEYPRREYPPPQFSQSEYYEIEYPRRDYPPPPQYSKSEYPHREYSESEFAQNEYLQNEYPSSRAYCEDLPEHPDRRHPQEYPYRGYPPVPTSVGHYPADYSDRVSRGGYFPEQHPKEYFTGDHFPRRRDEPPHSAAPPPSDDPLPPWEPPPPLHSDEYLHQHREQVPRDNPEPWSSLRGGAYYPQESRFKPEQPLWTKPASGKKLKRLQRGAVDAKNPYKVRGNPRISRPAHLERNSNTLPTHVVNFCAARRRPAPRPQHDFTEDVTVEEGSSQDFGAEEGPTDEAPKSPLGCVLVRGGPGTYERHSLLFKPVDLHEESEEVKQKEPDLRELLSRKPGEVQVPDLRESLSRKVGEPQDLREALSRKPAPAPAPSIALEEDETQDLRQSLLRRHAADADLRVSLRTPCEGSDLRETLSRKKAVDDLRITLSKKRSPVKPVVVVEAPSSPDQPPTPPPSPRLPPAPAPSPPPELPSTLSPAVPCFAQEKQDHRGSVKHVRLTQEDSLLHSVASELREILEDYETVEGQSLLNSLEKKSGQDSSPMPVKSPIDFELFPFRKRACDFFNYEFVNSVKTAHTPPPSPNHSYNNYDFNGSSECLQRVEAFLAAFRCEMQEETQVQVEAENANSNTEELVNSISNIKQRLRKRSAAVSYKQHLRKRSAVVSYTSLKLRKRLTNTTKIVKRLVPKKVKKTSPKVKCSLTCVKECSNSEAALKVNETLPESNCSPASPNESSSSEDDMPLIERLRRKQSTE
ncbi:Exocyst complex component 8 [Frankliniella fusca]|uniref:Exocyst complex component 8 n=1 Tax=Frankliniella fusca TaxID=407009 RepID=A0AAE1GUD7_9NEOP|nr:Exocyst complex component 8 [Frankliniella fusca]